MRISFLRSVVIVLLCAVTAQGCAVCKRIFVRTPRCEAVSSYSGSRKFLAYQAEPGIFKAEMRVRSRVLWEAALSVFRDADILESNADSLTVTTRYRDAICSLAIKPRDERSCEVEMKITDYNGVVSYNLWGRDLLKKLYNKATSISFLATKQFSGDDGK